MDDSTIFEKLWHGLILAVILLICVQFCCAVLGGILYWDALKSVLSH